MKLSWSQPAHSSRRATNFLRSSSVDTAESNKPPSSSFSLSSLFWLLLHGLCCLSSLLLGFRFSRVVFFLLFSTATTTIYTSTTLTTSTSTTLTTTTTTTTTLTGSLALPHVAYHATTSSPNQTSSGHVVVGRHGIRIRPWPHPDPTETERAHRILELVQREQQRQHSVRSPRRVIVVTPTYVRTFQAPHLTGVMHTLMLIPYDLTWIVVEEAGEGGGTSRETASIFAKSNLDVVHVPFVVDKKKPVEWSDRHRMETRMRLHALRVIRDRRLDGIVVFADDSNIHSTELFDEVQKVKWMGAVSVGILARSARPSQSNQTKQTAKENLPLPIQGPACDASGRLAGWHTFNTLPDTKESVGMKGMVLPTRLEWSGFVMNSRLLWRSEAAEGKPGWARSLDDVGKNGEEIDSPLGLLKDASFVEPLGDCGKKVLLWWLRAEARSDSKFPPGWIIEPSLEVIVPSKHT